ncbi:MAG: PilZ domain-containing protein [Terriglobales bacterium]|jgi:hypothetical protein
MPERTTAEEERRRSPRFSCGGHATITRLPSSGIFLPGRILDLSLGGCRVDTIFPIDCGVRAEIVAHVNAASFRAVGEVRASPGRSGACIEFVRLSTGGKDMLADLIAELERLQAVMNQLKSGSPQIDPESFRWQLENGRQQAAMLSKRLRLRGRILTTESAGESSEPQVTSAGKDLIAETQALLISVDLFG